MVANPKGIETMSNRAYSAKGEVPKRNKTPAEIDAIKAAKVKNRSMRDSFVKGVDGTLVERNISDKAHRFVKKNLRIHGKGTLKYIKGNPIKSIIGATFVGGLANDMMKNDEGY